MRAFDINMPTGALRLYTVDGRPSFLPGDREIVLFPSDVCDHSVLLGRRVSIPEAIGSLSVFFYSYRGIPGECLDVEIDGTVHTLPKFDTPSGKIKISAPKCKQLITKEITLSGIPEMVYTVIDKRNVRFIEGGPDYPNSLLSRLLVVDGLPVADIVFAFRIVGNDVHLESSGSINFNSLNLSDNGSIDRQLADHLFMLKEQLEYTLSNLDSTHFIY